MKLCIRMSLLGALLLTLAFRAGAQNAAFLDTLKQNRFAVSTKDGHPAGPGAEVLRAATADAQFVLLGEDHGIVQVPEFAAALCAELAPHGFHHLALETGPSVTPNIEKFARTADGAKQLAAFDKRYPESVAFYIWREEFAFLQACERAAPGGMTLWGMDQELMGAPAYLLEKILETNPGPDARAAVNALLHENNEDHAAAVKSGSPEDMFLLKAKQAELDQARDLLKKQGNAEAQKLFEAILVSREIYQKNMAGAGYASNRQRALLMKKNFVEPFTQEFQKSGAPPKVLFKLGAWHMYHGINPLHSSELGNLIGEAAEGHEEKAVHILILGVKGEQLRFAGIGRAFQPVPLDLAAGKDSDFLFLKPLFDNQIENLWTLYDLRGLRDHFRRYGKIDPELERIIFGFDFVVLIPDPKASHSLE